MRFERMRAVAALLGLGSVFAALFAYAPMTPDIRGLPSQSVAMWIALCAAATSAVTSILLSRELARKRRARNVFIIYARADLAVARQLAHQMRSVGLRPWLDVDEVLPGQIWKTAIAEALEASSVAVVLVSKNFENGNFVQEEVTAAIKLLHSNQANVMPIIPVRTDDTAMPSQLARIQWIDLRENGAEKKLLEGLARATGITLLRPEPTSDKQPTVTSTDVSV